MQRLLLFLLFVFIVAAVLRVDFYFTIAYLFFGVYLLARLWVRRGLKDIRIERRFVDRAFHGDSLPVRLSVRNVGRLPVTWLHARESVPVSLRQTTPRHQVFSLDPGERRDIDYALYCSKRGVYNLGPTRLQTGDVLGLIKPENFEAPPDRLIVYPKVVPLQSLGLPTRSPLATLPAPLPLFEDPARVVGVRDYAPGDSLRRIHWTASASAGTLLVKHYQPAIARETLVCLDLGYDGYHIRGRYDAIELAIVAAASIANHVVVGQRLPVGLATDAYDVWLGERTSFALPIRAERAHLMAALEILARVNPVENAPFVELLRRQRLHLPWGTTVVAITGRDTPELLDALAQMVRAGFPAALVLTQPERMLPETARRAAMLRVPIYQLDHERDLGVWT